MAMGHIRNVGRRFFDYTKLRYALNKDRQKVRDVLDWTQSYLRDKIQPCHDSLYYDLEGCEDWWESQMTSLLELIETPAQYAKRVFPDEKEDIF